NVSEVLNKSLLNTKAYLKKILPHDFVLRGLWAWYDYHNVKMAIKAHLLHKSWPEMTEYLSPFGEISWALLQENVMEKIRLPHHFEFDKDRALKLFEQENDQQVIDFIFDQELYKYLGRWSQKLHSPFLQTWLKHSIDFKNAQLYIRLLKREIPDLANDIFLLNGFIEVDLWKKPWAEVIDNLLARGEKNLAQWLEDLYTHQDYQLFFVRTDNFLMDYLRQARFIPDGPEPIFAYWWGRKTASEVIRTIFIAKKNHLKAEEIRPYLKKLY
ncbi:MAG TPA: V-type ATPase subunit, partial [Candidatus Gracilibacteria bacterium]|nr:V-type ATPase subunit [Candidatus Gracilibacteria bacterium]